MRKMYIKEFNQSVMYRLDHYAIRNSISDIKNVLPWPSVLKAYR